MGNLLVRAYHTVMARIETDLAMTEHTIDCPHQEIGACGECRDEWTCLGAS